MNEPVGGIYEIVNTLNGKRYVGSAVNFTARWREHQRQLRGGKHHSRYLQRAWNKHGPDAFEFRQIETCSQDQLLVREQFALDAMRPAYNIAKVAGNTLGVRYTKEARLRLSAALKGKMKGRPQSPGHVEARAAQHRGRKRPESTRLKISAAMAGKKQGQRSEEHRAKLSAALKGRAKSPEHLAALQEGRRRRVYTDAHRAAISEAGKRAYADGRRSRERPPEYRAKIAATLRERAKDPAVRAKLRQQAIDAAAMRTAAAD
jgi:group I intron endonuclease